jgi:hypothetical protein
MADVLGYDKGVTLALQIAQALGVPKDMAARMTKLELAFEVGELPVMHITALAGALDGSVDVQCSLQTFRLVPVEAGESGV